MKTRKSSQYVVGAKSKKDLSPDRQQSKLGKYDVKETTNVGEHKVRRTNQYYKDIKYFNQRLEELGISDREYMDQIRRDYIETVNSKIEEGTTLTKRGALGIALYNRGKSVEKM